jgi:hypothetical protein
VKRAIAAASTIVGMAALVYTVWAIGIANVQDTIGRIGWGFAAILLISGLREVTRAVAWTQTFTGTARLPIADALRARLAGEALNALVPMGFLIGEPTKAQHVDHRMPFATAFGALMLEFAFYTASLALLLGAALLALVPGVAVLGVGIVGGRIPALTRVHSLLEPLRRFAIEQPRRAATIAALEAGYHALGIAEAYVTLCFLLPSGATWTAALLFETVNRVVTIVFKMIPMRVGIDEAGAAFLAPYLAIGPAAGVMLALVRKLRLLFWSALGLLVIAVRAIRRCAPARTGRAAEC